MTIKERDLAPQLPTYDHLVAFVQKIKDSAVTFASEKELYDGWLAMKAEAADLLSAK